MQTDNTNTIALKSKAIAEKLFDANELGNYTAQNLEANASSIENYFYIMVIAKNKMNVIAPIKVLIIATPKCCLNFR